MSSAIVARELCRSFDGRLAVEQVSFAVEAGEVFGLLGPNGAGKTTTVRMLCGLLRPSAGGAEVCGLTLGRDDAAIRANVGLLTEQPGLYDRLTARQNLLYFARLYGLSRQRAEARVAELLGYFSLSERAGDRVGGFSKGMRQKLAIARAIVHEPRVVFLDEPTSGLDPEAGLAVRELVRRLAREGRAVVLCTHNLDDAERLCDRVAVIKQRPLAVGAPRELARRHPVVELEVAEAAGLLAPLGAEPGVVSATLEGGRLRVELRDGEAVPELVVRVVALGGRIRSVRPLGGELERLYLELVGGAGSRLKG